MSNKSIVIFVSCLFGLFFVVIIVLWTFFLSSGSVESKEHTVQLTAEGFKPAMLTINVGDTVLFTTDLGIEFWPASDPHPVHNAHSDFDPMMPVGPGETWRYTFLQAGEYKYHDHLNSFFIGIIYVE